MEGKTGVGNVSGRDVGQYEHQALRGGDEDVIGSNRSVFFFLCQEK